MCDPVTLAVASAASIGSSIAGAIGQNQRSAETGKLAVADLGQKYNATQLRETQEQSAAQLQILNAQKEGRSSVSKARASASEAGVTGSSVSELQQTIQNHVSDYTEATKQNLQGKLLQLQSGELADKAQAQGEIDSAPAANPFDVGLRVLGEGAQGVSTYDNAKFRAQNGTGPT